MKSNGQYKVVYTYGWYLRKFIMDAREKGAIPIIITHTPRNKFDNGLIESNANSFGAWTKEVAKDMDVMCIDLNTLAGEQLQHIADEEGLIKVNAHFKRDHTHSSLLGARLNASIVAESLKNILK